MAASPVINEEPPMRLPVVPRRWRRHRDSGLLDALFQALLLAAGFALIGIVVCIAYELLRGSLPTLERFGLKFFTGRNWDPVAGDFGALPFLYGTVVSSFLALLLAAPLAVAVAVFVTEMCPRPLRSTISFLTELLAAIPSVIYGLWAIFVLVPLLRTHAEPWLARHFGWTGLF